MIPISFLSLPGLFKPANTAPARNPLGDVTFPFDMIYVLILFVIINSFYYFKIITGIK